MERLHRIRLGVCLVLCAACGGIYADTAKPSAQLKVSATIVPGCLLSNVEQHIFFNKRPATVQTKVTVQISNTSQSWNIRCTEKISVTIKLSNGENFLNNHWRMKHQSQDEYIPYLFYQDSSAQVEYKAGEAVSLAATTAQERTLQFLILAVADLNNDNQARSAGVYKDSVTITIAW